MGGGVATGDGDMMGVELGLGLGVCVGMWCVEGWRRAERRDRVGEDR